MKENVKKSFYCILTLFQVSKHWYLINKYHRKSCKIFVILSAGSAFSFSAIGSKTKTWNWRNVFYMFYYKLDLPNFKQRSLKLFEYTCLFHSLVGICFYFQKWSHHFYPSFQNWKNKSCRRKNVKKRFYV